MIDDLITFMFGFLWGYFVRKWQQKRKRSQRPCSHPPGCTFCAWCGFTSHEDNKE